MSDFNIVNNNIVLVKTEIQKQLGSIFGMNEKKNLNQMNKESKKEENEMFVRDFIARTGKKRGALIMNMEDQLKIYCRKFRKQQTDKIR